MRIRGTSLLLGISRFAAGLFDVLNSATARATTPAPFRSQRTARPTTPGAKLWVSRYNGPANGYDSASAIGVRLAGTMVFVTGGSVAATPGTGRFRRSPAAQESARAGRAPRRPSRSRGLRTRP
jgi:hypothetical protein